MLFPPENIAGPKAGSGQPRRAEPQGRPPGNPILRTGFAFSRVIDRICNLPWETISEDEVLRVALAYYYFSIQFRENLEVTCRLHPGDARLALLHREECNTDNLSPWEGVAAPGERMNHDEFMRRLLALQPLPDTASIVEAGEQYLKLARGTADTIRAKSIASYEDGGLERVFTAMLRAQSWQGPGQKAFRFFLEQHIKFDSNEESGHGALSRHIPVDDSILPLWAGFLFLLTSAVSGFSAAAARAPTTGSRPKR
jgi:hypothetical protein